MDDVKKTYREGEQNDQGSRAQGRRRREPGRPRRQRWATSCASRPATLGDDLDTAADNAGDAGKEAWRKADGDEDLADKVGNAGDDMRRSMDDPR